MSAWKRIIEVLNEDIQYRGDTFVTYAELTKLFVGDPERDRPGFTGHPPDPKGGVATGNYVFDPSILALGDSSRGSVDAWWDDLETALARATTASSKEIGAGMGSGGTMTKGTYGDKVRMQMAPVQPHHNDRLGSTMDRYDVVLVSDVSLKPNRKGLMVPIATLRKVAWAPSMGTQEERAARLQGALLGRPVDAPRRAQPHRPNPPEKSNQGASADVQRQGGRMGMGTSPPKDQELRGMGMGYKRKNPVPKWYNPHGLGSKRKNDDDGET